MADNLDDGEFWLPPQFLTDDDDDTSFNNAKNDAVSKSLFFSSSSETESDEEDHHLAELTRRVALELDLNNNNNSAKPKGVFGGGSPQSILSAFGSSGKGSSPNGAVPHVNSSSTWDLLRAAAGEVERMRDGYSFLTPSPVAAAAQPNAVNGVVLGFYYQQPQPHQQQPSHSQQQLQIAQFEMLRKQQQQRQMVPPNRGRNNNSSNNVVRVGNVVNGIGLSASAWPPNGSGMRAVFLSGKRERSTGTGVFLPRCVDTRNNNESRKKPVCNTVLVSDRVAQALNLEGVVGGGRGHKQQHKPRFNGENGSPVSRVRSNNNNNNHYGYGYSHHQKRNNLKPQQQPQVVVNHEIQLPLEWTY
ncbi:hypothetical protein JHK87_001269 [Glycine soja]|nr:hypothetical protein JHK87_001269 [Glycine soja]